MAKRYLYVLSSYADAAATVPTPGELAFEYQRLIKATGADIVSLSTLGAAGQGIRTRLTGRLLIQRLRLAALVARRARRYDAIVASREDIGVLITLALRAARRRTPLVMVTHGPQFQPAKFQLVLSLVKSMLNVVFACLSHSLANWLAAEHGIDPRRSQSTEYGVDTGYFHTVSASTEVMVASAGSSNCDYDTLLLAVGPTGIDTRIASHSAWVGATASVQVAKPDHVEIRSYEN